MYLKTFEQSDLFVISRIQDAQESPLLLELLVTDIYFQFQTNSENETL